LRDVAHRGGDRPLGFAGAERQHADRADQQAHTEQRPHRQRLVQDHPSQQGSAHDDRAQTQRDRQREPDHAQRPLEQHVAEHLADQAGECQFDDHAARGQDREAAEVQRQQPGTDQQDVRKRFDGRDPNGIAVCNRAQESVGGGVADGR
jgi:hypothetical protein